MAIPFCESWDFADGCPPDLVGAGDMNRDDAFHGCNNGRVRVVAKNTLDHSVTLSTKTPSQPYRAHVAATATLAEWSGNKGRDVIALLGQSGTLAVIRAESATTSLIYSFCVGPDTNALVCVGATVSAPKGTPHRLAIDVADGGRVAFSFDCKEVASTSAQIQLTTQSTLKLRFGDVDGDALDGQLDDVIIALPLL